MAGLDQKLLSNNTYSQGGKYGRAQLAIAGLELHECLSFAFVRANNYVESTVLGQNSHL